MSRSPALPNAGRVVPVPPIYRAMMAECERRRAELGWSMATVDDKAGLNDGHYAKMLYPDTPSGRMAQMATVELAFCALFGRGWALQIVPDDSVVPSALSMEHHPSAQSREIRHWRHTRHFRELGAKGAKARMTKLSPRKRTAIARKAARKRWSAPKVEEMTHDGTTATPLHPTAISRRPARV